MKLPWADTVDDDHYDDAYDFLSLYWLPAKAGPAVAALRDAEIVKHPPGDVLRAAGLEPLPLDDAGVRREIRKAIDAGAFQPALCINLPAGVVVADGLHRLSAAYALAPHDPAHLKLAPSAKEALDA